jgi:hypothetical protein
VLVKIIKQFYFIQYNNIIFLNSDREHPSHSYFHELERNTGSFSNTRVIANQQPIQVNALGEDIELRVLAYVRANPRVSTRHVGFKIGISHNAVHKILKKQISSIQA